MALRNLASAVTLSTLAFASKAFLRLTTNEYKVNGLAILTKALESDDKPSKEGACGEPQKRRGIVTLCNHNSVVDDPMMWSLLPLNTYFPFTTPSRTCRNNRWTLGASDIMFTKPTHAKFFELGQVIETHRGGGIFQKAVDRAVQLLQDGSWIHIFPEGKVNQQLTNPAGGLLRFKWGIGRIIMDSKVMPEIIPIWISGFDQIMNETRTAPRFIPRPGAKISITVGQSLSAEIQPLVDQWRQMAQREAGTLGVGGEWSQNAEQTGPVGDEQREIRGKGDLIDGREEEVRIKIVEVLQEGLRKLGQEVERSEGRFEQGIWSQSTAQTPKSE